MSPFASYDSMDACERDHSDKDDPGAYCAQIHYEVTGEWPSEKYAKLFEDQDSFSTPIEVAELAVEKNDIPRGMWAQINSESISPFRKLAASETDPRRFKRVIDMVKLSRSEDEVSDVLSKADSVEKVDFNAQLDRSVSMVFKQDDEFLIWGPASVEIVDKEDDKVSVEALDKALPQLLKRASLSYAHTDQLVGKILERFKTEEPIEVTIDGTTYERSEFPTAVLDLDDGNPPGMFVAGEVFNDTNQSQEVRRKIEEGEIDSYSISGEALVTQKQIDGNMVYDDILEMDLSAVTLCEEGMNQGAKFARVTGDVEEVAYPDVEKQDVPSFEVSEGSVSSPQQVNTAVAKSMTENEEENESEKGDGVPSDFNPDAYLKRDDFEGEIATKEDVEKVLDETVEKTVDAVVDEVEKTIPSEEDIAEVAKEQLSSQLPAGSLATVGYIKENFARKEEEEEEEEEKSDEEEYEEEESEEEKEDVEIEVEEEDDDDDGEEKEDEGDEEVEVNVEEDEDDDTITREQLKEDLPGDVWTVVSEYVGDTKQKSADEEEGEDINDLEKAVASILDGKEISSPGVDLSERAEEQDEMFKAEDEDSKDARSPALAKWR